MVAEPGTNSIVVSASADNMKKIETMVLDLDKPGTAAQVTTKIDIKDGDANDVASALNDIYSPAPRPPAAVWRRSSPCPAEPTRSS